MYTLIVVHLSTSFAYLFSVQLIQSDKQTSLHHLSFANFFSPSGLIFFVLFFFYSELVARTNFPPCSTLLPSLLGYPHTNLGHQSNQRLDTEMTKAKPLIHGTLRWQVICDTQHITQLSVKRLRLQPHHARTTPFPGSFPRSQIRRSFVLTTFSIEYTEPVESRPYRRNYLSHIKYPPIYTQVSLHVLW
jgi:hypothetical protein